MNRHEAEALRGTTEVRYLTSNVETRSASDGKLHFDGLGSVTECPYDMGSYMETVKRGAFHSTLSRPDLDVQLLANHEGLPLARTTNGSLALQEDAQGLRFSAIADPADGLAADVHSRVASGLMDQCSFAFRVVRDKWNADYDQRSMLELDLHRGDVSIVNYGASPSTSIDVRSLLAVRDRVDPQSPGGIDGRTWAARSKTLLMQLRSGELSLDSYADEHAKLGPRPPVDLLTFQARAQLSRFKRKAS
jgi:HK97 family phage prohead protease